MTKTKCDDHRIVRRRSTHSHSPLNVSLFLIEGVEIFSDHPISFIMSAQPNYRLINIDRLDPDSPNNFDLSTLVPGGDEGRRPSITITDAQTLAGQVRQLLRGGDSEGALRGALENVPYGGDDRVKV